MDTIHPQSEILEPTSAALPEIEPALVNDFEEFGLSKETRKSIEKMKYTTATAIQKACIPFLMDNVSDIIALAKTGTGKTAAFGIPMIEKIDLQGGLQGLVLCPTRELAQQVALNIKNMGDQKGIRVATILGGESYDKQLRALRANPHVVVSTPGRLIDLIDQKIIKLETVRYYILDEADEMLSFGFQDALEQIWKSLDEKAGGKSKIEDKTFNTWLFSATMSESIKKLAKKYLNTPHEVRLNTKMEKIKVDSYAAVIFEEDKVDALSLLIKNEPEFYGLIFATTKKQVAELELCLRNLGLDVDSLHGDKVQAERTRTINRMKAKQTKILVATDVAARGLDIQDLSHVVNFEIPWDVETYTHRIGRTARAGKTGIVWTMVKPKESPSLRRFERALDFEFKKLVIPTVEDVQVFQKVKSLKEIAKQPFRESEFVKFEKAILKLENEDIQALSLETRQWLARAFQYFGQSEELHMKQPRSLEMRKGNDSYSGGGDRGGYADRGPRQSNDRYGGNRGGYSNDRGGGSSTGSGARWIRNDNFRSDDRGPRNDNFRPDNRNGGGEFRREPQRDSFRADTPRAGAPSFGGGRKYGSSDSSDTRGSSAGGGSRGGRFAPRSSEPRESGSAGGGVAQSKSPFRRTRREE